jgi:Site-specific recombinase XerD
MSKWLKTEIKGIRYRKHHSRKVGVQPDRYYSIRYQVDGRRVEMGVMWLSDFAEDKKAGLLKQYGDKIDKTDSILAYCKDLLKTLKSNALKANGEPVTLKEKREIVNGEKARNVTIAAFCVDSFLPYITAVKKAETARKMKGHMGKWVIPTIGPVMLCKLNEEHIHRLKSVISETKSPRLVQYVFNTLGQLWAYALKMGIATGLSPLSGVKVEKYDNRRQRYLTKDDSELLLQELLTVDETLHNMALISLHTGMRAGEIFGLEWQDVNFNDKTILIRDPKNKESRHAFMTDRIYTMLRGLTRGLPGVHIFMDKHGSPFDKVPWQFKKIADGLFNAGIADSRQRVVFHTLRHTFCSWLAADGIDLYTISKLAGHKDLRMTQRYSHLSNETLRRAAARVEANGQYIS